MQTDLRLNQSVGLASNITDYKAYNTSNMLQGRVAGVVVTGYGSDKKAQLELPSIEFEKIKVAVNVNVKFMLK